MNAVRNYRYWTQEELEEFVRLWQSGHTPREIGERFTIPPDQVRVKASTLRKRGVPLIQRSGERIEVDFDRLKSIAAKGHKKT